ncbi:Hypothetical_protein [Hexamita inflata]|uniref:Hypothetical_protein n=1 Tax=Hexamita inflata TaxID=28002 RepID=A0AA86TPC4_9EUKA|nr:Hypothetical protein HINF_LOCUS9587 [Hexamita inflata]
MRQKPPSDIATLFVCTKNERQTKTAKERRRTRSQENPRRGSWKRQQSRELRGHTKCKIPKTTHSDQVVHSYIFASLTAGITFGAESCVGDRELRTAEELLVRSYYQFNTASYSKLRSEVWSGNLKYRAGRLRGNRLCRTFSFSRPAPALANTRISDTRYGAAAESRVPQIHSFMFRSGRFPPHTTTGWIYYRETTTQPEYANLILNEFDKNRRYEYLYWTLYQQFCIQAVRINQRGSK